MVALSGLVIVRVLIDLVRRLRRLIRRFTRWRVIMRRRYVVPLCCGVCVCPCVMVVLCAWWNIRRLYRVLVWLVLLTVWF